MSTTTDSGRSVDAELEAALEAAVGATRPFAQSHRAERSAWLTAVAAGLDESRADLVPIAVAETGIDPGRLESEVDRTVGQLRMFADVVRDGSYLEVIIDDADPNAAPLPRPDLRRLLMPLGPVAVFAASNFPFAFSVAGGDTASALATGCPVVVKAHPGHPELSVATARVVQAALSAAGAPEGIFSLVQGLETGRALVTAPPIRAVGFTGSLAGGRALFDLASSRPTPIPFYGELGSLNPVFVTPGAARRDPEGIAAGFVASVMTSNGQLCTKPGLLFVPQGSGVAEAVAAGLKDAHVGRLLNEQIATTFRRTSTAWSDVAGVESITDPAEVADAPAIARTTVSTLLAHRDPLLHENFGPASLIVEYADQSELEAAATSVPESLAAAVFAEVDDPEVPGLQAILVERTGRLCWNGWPTGVAVTWSMHHGGPFPATTSSLHTSVGATAVRRWLRPVLYQGWPHDLLPHAARDGAATPARRNGVLPPSRTAESSKQEMI